MSKDVLKMWRRGRDNNKVQHVSGVGGIYVESEKHFIN